MLYAALLVGVPAVTAAIVERRLAATPGRRVLVLSIAMWAVLGGRSLGREARRLAGCLGKGDLDAARARAPALMGRDPSRLDASELCRGAIESVAENTADAAVGPLLWGAVLGLPGIVGYRAANTLDAMVGHLGDRYEQFGWASARLDDALTYVPARLAALASVAMAPIVGGRCREAARTLRRDGHKHPSPNAGQLEAAFAGALHVRLGGTNHYDGTLERRPGLGDGRAPTPHDVTRAVTLSTATIAVCAVSLALLAQRLGR